MRASQSARCRRDPCGRAPIGVLNRRVSAMRFSGLFDPFNDRRSRDVRNSLSQAFVQALDRGDDRALADCVRGWLEQDTPPAVQQYAAERLRRYRAVIDVLKSLEKVDDMAVAVEIWNRQLFFEMHEYLEGIWKTERGEEREALKGLIQAAGAYVHREHQNLRSAGLLAAKAADRLSTRSRRLQRIANLVDLRRGLSNLAKPPPQLFLRDS